MHETGAYCWYNKLNGMRYVGGAYKSFTEREKSHRNSLRRGDHFNQHLQRAWNKYGEDAFEFYILQRCRSELKRVVEVEQFWMDLYQSYEDWAGYNICRTAGHPGGTGTGKPLSEEVKKKIRLSNLGQKRSEETRKKMSEAFKGRKRSKESNLKAANALRGRKHSDEVKQKMSEMLIKAWKLRRLEGRMKRKGQGKSSEGS